MSKAIRAVDYPTDTLRTPDELCAIYANAKTEHDLSFAWVRTIRDRAVMHGTDHFDRVADAYLTRRAILDMAHGWVVR